MSEEKARQPMMSIESRMVNSDGHIMESSRFSYQGGILTAVGPVRLCATG